MKLYFTNASPYARKIRVLLLEKQAGDRVIVEAIDPWSDPAVLQQAVPSGKVPALINDEGWGIGESWAIADYLDEVLPGPRLLPEKGPERWQALRRAAIAQGILDAAFTKVVEGRRPDGERSPSWLARQQAALDRAIAHLATEPVPAQFDMGALSLACALDYLHFRLPELAWAERAPAWGAWFDGVNQRPSMRATDPRG